MPYKKHQYDFTPGELNPISYSGRRSQKIIKNNNVIDDPMSSYRKIIKSSINPNLYKNVRTFRAIVLDVIDSDLQYSYIGSVLNRLGKILPQAGDFPVYRCRIPELHAHITDPLETSDPEMRSRLTFLHPIFELQQIPGEGAPSIDYASIQEGTIVEIEFSDFSHSNGIIKEIVNATGLSRPPDALGLLSPTAIFNQGFFASEFTGDTQTPEEIKECAETYDDPPTPYNANLNKSKNRHSLIGTLHPEFQPYVKCFIWRCWLELGGVEIQLNSGFRGFDSQEKLYNAYQACLAAGGKTGVDCIPAAKPSRPTATGHGSGLAFDMNPRFRNGSTFPNGKDYIGGLESRATWQASGIVQIAKEIGLSWGGDWEHSYDPVHFHAGSLARYNTAELRQRELDEGLPANQLPGILKV